MQDCLSKDKCMCLYKVFLIKTMEVKTEPDITAVDIEIFHYIHVWTWIVITLQYSCFSWSVEIVKLETEIIQNKVVIMLCMSSTALCPTFFFFFNFHHFQYEKKTTKPRVVWLGTCVCVLCKFCLMLCVSSGTTPVCLRTRPTTFGEPNRFTCGCREMIYHFNPVVAQKWKAAYIKHNA